MYTAKYELFLKMNLAKYRKSNAFILREAVSIMVLNIHVTTGKYILTGSRGLLFAHVMTLEIRINILGFSILSKSE